jgi:hypothetical protein
LRDLKYPNGGGGYVYIEDGEEIGGFTVNRPNGDELFNDLFVLMKDVGAVVYWPGEGPCIAVAEPAIIADLPSDMLEAIGPAVTVASGAEIIETISRS